MTNKTMKDDKAQQTSSLLDDSVITRLDQAILPVPLSAQKKESMRQNIFDRIENPKNQSSDLITVKQNEGNWIQIAPKLQKKRLAFDPASGVETFLLKADPGAEIPEHQHQHDEFSFIIEGSAHFSDLELNAGDFHFAPKGSTHSHVTCPVGALIYLRTG